MKKYFILILVLGFSSNSLISQEESAPLTPDAQSSPIENPVTTSNDTPDKADADSAPDVTLQVESESTDDAELSTPPEQPEVVKVEKQIEYGGVLLQILQPEKVSESETVTVEPPRKKTNPLQWFNPFAPAEYGNGGTIETQWTGRRRLPTRFRRVQESEPIGINLFFIRF